MDNRIAGKVNEIVECLCNYRFKIKTLNRMGLFDEAKHFELFALQIAHLWFNEEFENCNKTRSNEPFVDLCSFDGTKHIQVSTIEDCASKIKATLEKIEASAQKSIQRLYFVLLNDVDKSKLVLNKTYSFFDKEDCIITLKDILNRVNQDYDFCDALYSLIINNFVKLQTELDKFHEALKKSSYDIAQLKTTIGVDYHIDTTTEINEIKTLGSKNIIILGAAGVGKTAFCKELLQDETCLFIRAEVLEENSRLDELWGFELEYIFEYLGSKRLYFFVDSLESIAATYRRNNLLGYLIEKCQHYSNIFVFFTCRTCDSNAFFELQTSYDIAPFEIMAISDEDLSALINRYPVLKKIPLAISKELLHNPWYLDSLLLITNSLNGLCSEKQIHNRIWEEIVCKDRKGRCKTTERDNVISQIIEKRANQRRLFVYRDDFDSDVVNSLISDGLLIESQDKRQVRVKHDIFEDIWFERQLDKLYDLSKKDCQTFFSAIERYNECIYRRYQIWVSNKIHATDGVEVLLDGIILNDDTPKNWKDRTIIGIVRSIGTQTFFEKIEGRLLRAIDVFQQFIDLINLYAFQINFRVSDRLSLVPSGDARMALIRIANKQGLFKNAKLRIGIIQLIGDCCESVNPNTYNNNKDCRDILVFVITKELAEIDDYDCSALISHLKLLYHFARVSKPEIISIWEQSKQLLRSTNNVKCRCAERIIEGAISFGNYELCKYIPIAVNELAEYYWRYDYTFPQKDLERYSMDKQMLEKAKNWGLSYEYGDHGYRQDNDLFLVRSYLYSMLQVNYESALGFIISFINKSVSIFFEQHPESLDYYKMVINGTEKEYLGCEEFWLAYRGGGAYIPSIIHDFLMILEYYLTKGIEQLEPIQRSKTLNYVKDYIVANSNNIMPLPILLSVAIKYRNEVKGYAIPLCTNIDFVMFDLYRLARETQYVALNGMGFHSKRYKKILDSFNKQDYRQESLQAYILSQQFNPSLIMHIQNILDNLYKTIKGRKDYAVLFLNIQKMDLRRSVVSVSNNSFVVETKATDETKELLDANEEKQRPILKFSESFNKLGVEFLKNPDSDLPQLEMLIEDVLTLSLREIFANRLNQHVKLLILLGLGKKDAVSNRTRERCVDYMLSFLNSVIMGEKQLAVPGMEDLLRLTHIFEEQDYYVLWTLLDGDLSVEYKKKIKFALLTLITQSEQNEIISNGIRIYLSSKPVLEKELKIIWIELIKREADAFGRVYANMFFNSQQFDYEKLFFELCESCPRDVDLGDFDNENVDCNKCFALCNFNISTMDTDDCRILNALLKIIASQGHDNRIDYYSTRSLEECLRRNILLNEEHMSATFELLSSILKSPLTASVIELFESIFMPLVAQYYDAYQDPSNRIKIVKIWDRLDSMISEQESLKKSLYNCLILTKSRWNMSWEGFPTAYSSEDKAYINNKFHKYGKYNLTQVIINTYELNSKELLPEILNSLSELIEQNYKEKIDEFINKKYYIISICRTAFIYHKESIRSNANLEKAYKGILNILIKLRMPEAAILLDAYNMY